MTIDQLSAVLQKKYSIKSFVDLSDLSHSPGAVYKLLYNLYQPAFDPDDRIVIYSSEAVSLELLKHLEDAANFVDISGWFIMLCTPSAIPDTIFQHLLTPLEPTKPLGNNYILPESICAIPWMNLVIGTDGRFSPCCESRESKKFGNIQTTSMQDAFHSDFMTSLRQDLLAGKKPDTCKNCWDIESRGLSSIRTYNIKRLKKTFLLERLESPSITSIDIKFNNTCNFKCRICNPQSSSLIAAEHQKFLNIPIQHQLKWSESNEFLNQVVELLPQLRFIDMYGGEPFLIKKFANVLRIAVEQGHAKNIRLHYNSNGSIWPEEFIPYWKHFKEVDIHFSIDAIGKRFELQRGGVWSDVEANILRIKNLNIPNLTINLMPTVNIMSVYYIDEVYEWGKKHGFDLFFSNLVDPAEFNIKNLTECAQKLVIEKFKDHPWSGIQNILNFVRSSKPSDGSEFRKKIKWFDSIRQENFVESHAEIAEAMGYVYNKTYDPT